MTSSLKIKITVSEFVTPKLFRAVSAVPNPRQRAGLIKRLAEDALRNSVRTSQIAPAGTSPTARDGVLARPAPSEAEPISSKRRSLLPDAGIIDEDTVQFHCECQADNSSVGGATLRTLQPVTALRHDVVTECTPPRDTDASMSSVLLDDKVSAMDLVQGPTTPSQACQDGEVPYFDTITQPSRRPGVLTWAVVAATLAVERSGSWFRRAISDRSKKKAKDIR